MSHEVWILGAGGRTGSAVAATLNEHGVPLVLVGRGPGRLEELKTRLGGAPRVLAMTLEQTLAELRGGKQAPSVVVNTIGPFSATALAVARALPAGTHYVDVSNEFEPVAEILGLDHHATTRGQVLVAAAGFGVLAAESAALKVLEGMGRAASLRVDVMASLASEAGPIGAALAGSIIEVLTFGGREVRGGRLVKAPTGANPQTLTTPDGDLMRTGTGASGELMAAWRASDADTVLAGSSFAPTNPVVRAVLPAITALVRAPGAARLAASRIAAITMKEAPPARAHSWAHARATWHSGQTRAVWLQIDDAMDFTVASLSEVALRLARGEGAPGAHTPGALFGHHLAQTLGATFIDDTTTGQNVRA
jgi:short subunit dehydrogenase-like uncharacterized protein